MNLTKLHTTVRQNLIWVLAPLILLPLATILILQFTSLRTLEQTLPAHRRDVLYGYLRAASQEAMSVYWSNAERALSLPSSSVANRKGGIVQRAPGTKDTRDSLKGVAEHFARNDFKGAQRYFVAVATDYKGEPGSEVLFFNPKAAQFETDPEALELRAINIVFASYLLYIRAGAKIHPGIMGNDRDARFSLALKPILDEEDRIVAIVGMVLDREWFGREVVPGVVRRTLPQVASSMKLEADVVLCDGNDNVSWSNRDALSCVSEAHQSFMPFFTRYSLGLSLRGLTGEQAARRSFLLNVTLSLVMTAVLFGGLLLALRAAIQERKLSQMKTDFVANVSHEFRTPLTSIRALAELLKWGRIRDFEKVSEYGELIDTQGRRLTQLVNNILDFARIESGQKEYRFERTHLREVVQETVEAAAIRLKQSNHSVRLDFEPMTPVVMVDREAMSLALSNLLDNAVKYSPEGTEIVVRVERDGSMVAVSVIDQGMGIPRSEHEKIFEKFYRVSTGMVHDVKGSGLGLSIVLHIVEAHHGRIGVSSEQGSGSVFTIQLPGELTDVAAGIRVEEGHEPCKDC